MATAAAVVADRQLAKKASVIFRKQTAAIKSKKSTYSETMDEYRLMWELVTNKNAGSHTLNTALALFCKTQRLKWVPLVLQEMLKKKIPPSVSTFTALTAICKNQTDIESLNTLVVHFSIPTDELYTNSIITQARRLKVPVPVQVDTSYKNCYISTTQLTSLTNVQEIIGFFDKLDAEGIYCNEIMASAAILGTAYSDSMVIYNYLVGRGDIEVLSSGFMSVLMKQIVSVKDISDVLQTAQQNNVPLTPTIVLSIINVSISISENGRQPELEDIMRHVVQLIFQHSFFNPLISSRLMTFYSKVGDLPSANSLFDHIACFRVEPLNEFYESYSRIPGSDPTKYNKKRADWKSKLTVII
eukprot:TRINITY_DN12234_c0_g1_i1.p1 TRINITY_DN12234_c0_g1~~TRINITY_DN12234_c0_g1_i1.p1  ORF type:complete len:357 (+),score=43.37 TRINITY_DN12234_c0_g1_i1:84-1154(+)